MMNRLAKIKLMVCKTKTIFLMRPTDLLCPHRNGDIARYVIMVRTQNTAQPEYRASWTPLHTSTAVN
jgi:hypothetical protein